MVVVFVLGYFSGVVLYIFICDDGWNVLVYDIVESYGFRIDVAYFG